MINSLIYVEQCSSTNDEILAFLPQKKEESVTLYTFDQTNGRGQYGNVWKSIAHQNLAFSMIFHQEKNKLSDALFNFHTANILRDFIAKKTDFLVKVKWPNDIIISNKKISGMIIERYKYQKENYLILGIGVNILQEDFRNLPSAGSILTQTNKKFALKEWAKEMNEYFIERLFEKVSSVEILERYHQFLFKKDEVAVFEINEMRQNGIIKKVDEKGFIEIDLENDGVKKFFHKEIKLLY